MCIRDRDDSPKFELNIDENAKVDVEDSDEKIVVKSGDAKLVITKESWSMTYYNKDQVMCKSSGRDLAYMKTDWTGEAYDSSCHKNSYMRQELSIGVGELL